MYGLSYIRSELFSLLYLPFILKGMLIRPLETVQGQGCSSVSSAHAAHMKP